MQNQSGYRRHVFWMVLVTTWLAFPCLGFSQDNLFRLRASTALKFATQESLPIAPGTSLEISFRRIVDFQPANANEYQCLAYFGNAQGPTLALVLTSDYDTGQAKLGVISTADRLNDVESYVLLTKIDNFGDVSELTVERGRTYHAMIVFDREPGTVDVYLDGHPQGSLRCDLSTHHGPDAFLAIGGKLPWPNSVNFDGEIGGLRVWERALPEPSVIALNKFGRSCEPHELTMLLEYGFLVAYGDFRGNSPARCQLKWPNRSFGGVWRESIATVAANIDGKGTFLDFPVYLFLPDLNGQFQVFEDLNYIGQLSGQAGDQTRWQFKHVESNWPAIDFRLQETLKSGRPTLQLVCPRLPAIPRPLAGKKTGDITLIRGTFDEDGSGISTQTFFSKAEKDRNKLTTDMTAVFLLGNNVRYKNVVYRGYNIAKMDKFNLFENGVNRTTNYVFAQPEQGLFAVDTDQIRILPTDLAINNLNMGLTSSESYYISNLSEYGQLVTSRLGAGVSTSLSVGTGSVSGTLVSVNGTVNLNVVLQSENSNELQEMETKNIDKLVSISSYRHYDLMHKKEMERLDPNFRNALIELYTAAKDRAPSDRQELINSFFDEWGTHFVFGGTFGAIKWTERTLEEKTVQEINRQSWNQFISVNEGKSGVEGSFSNTMTETFKSSVESTISVGGNAAGEANSPAGPGDEPAPIALDLRMLSQLCSPQFFPENQEIYTQLRTWLDLAYPQYLRNVVVRQLQENNPSPELAAKAERFLETGEWSEIEPRLYQVQIGSAKFEFRSALTGEALTAREIRDIKSLNLNVRLKSATGSSEYVFLHKDKPTQFALSTQQNAHFVPFSPGENETIQVSMEALLNIQADGSTFPVSVNKIADSRPQDCEFFFDPEMKAAESTKAAVAKWAQALPQFNSRIVKFAAEEFNRPRQFYFSQKDGLGDLQSVTHLLGPFSSGDSLPLCYIAVTTEYRLTRVPSTSSLWANLTANSRSAIKSNDTRFGAFLAGPPTTQADFQKNRSTAGLFQPPRPPQALPVKTGDGR